MTWIHTPLTAALTAVTLIVGSVSASMVQAACVAEYKAKRDTPFELYYDTAPISGPCTKTNAQAKLQAQLAQQGLTLLKVLSVRDQ